MTAGILAAAAALDLAVGDPDHAWHPVRRMGALIRWTEARARRDGRRLKLRGTGLVLLVLATVYACGLLALRAAAWADTDMGFEGWANFTVQALMVWSCLGIRSMTLHAQDVLAALRQGDLAGARLAVARIVGRDCAGLDEPGVCRACLESVAESLGDGVMGPLFFAGLGGGPLALVYRAANTLDSMLGHDDEEYRELGWASAKADDLLSWIPARKAALFAILAAAGMGLDFRSAWRVARKDARAQASPNSGWPEGAFAGALGVRLGGPLSYRGERVDKAFLGEARRPLDVAVCEQALKLFLAASLVAVLVDEALAWYGLH
jgi:adenosylcobinamide-phosphate synthase